MGAPSKIEQFAEAAAASSRAVATRKTPSADWIAGEFLGTFLMVFFGCGAVAAAVLLGAQVGVFQVAIVWGLGVATAIYLTGSLGGAHLNPAVTLAMAVWSDFPKSRILPYFGLQLLGAFCAAAVVHVLFADSLRVYEISHAIVRGQPGSEATAMIFGEFFPNPGGQPLTDAIREKMSPFSAFVAEGIATAILVLIILAVTDDRNATRPQILTPLTIGLAVTLLISLLGPLTMACMNPARDLGPRIFSGLAGWGAIPFTANGWGWLTVYLLAPLGGGLAGGAFYRFLLRPAYRLAQP